MTAGTEREIGARLPVLVLLVPPVALWIVRLPLVFLDAPLGRVDNLLAVDLADEALLPAKPNHPLHVLQVELPERAGLLEIGDDGAVLPVRDGRTDHLVVRTAFPALVMRG